MRFFPFLRHIVQSSNFSYQPRLDQLRALAAGIVFLFHVYHFYYWQWQPVPGKPWLALIAEGHTGVGLFFALSGYLFMQIALHSGSIDYGRFLRNRLLRIFPLFLVVFFVAISVGRDEFRAADVLYLLFSNLGQAPTSNSFITGAAWTISVEFTFYLIFPFLARFALAEGPAYLWRCLLLLAVIKLGAFLVTERSTHMLYSTLVGRLDQFLIGMLVAQYCHRHASVIERYALPVLCCGILGISLGVMALAQWASYFSPAPKHWFWLAWPTLEAGSWALLIAGWHHTRLPLPNWLARGAQQLGEVSFSFYLWHGLVIYILHRLLGPLAPTGIFHLDALLNALLLFVVSFALARLSFLTVERPFLGMRGRYSGLGR